MSYLTQSEIASNEAMHERVAQAAAEQAIADPDTWATDHRREYAAAPGWGDAWASAHASHPPPEPPEYAAPYDPGTDEAVITDAMILSWVQSVPAG